MMSETSVFLSGKQVNSIFIQWIENKKALLCNQQNFKFSKANYSPSIADDCLFQVNVICRKDPLWNIKDFL